MSSDRTALHTTQAPAAIGPYSQAIQLSAGKLTWLSGQIPINPSTGELVQGDIAAQTERVMENLKAVLGSGGLGFEHVVRCTVYLVDMADFAQVNTVYGRYFSKTPPARATVAVAALPKGARVEIDAVAVS